MRDETAVRTRTEYPIGQRGKSSSPATGTVRNLGQMSPNLSSWMRLMGTARSWETCSIGHRLRAATPKGGSVVVTQNASQHRERNAAYSLLGASLLDSRRWRLLRNLLTAPVSIHPHLSPLPSRERRSCRPHDSAPRSWIPAVGDFCVSCSLRPHPSPFTLTSVLSHRGRGGLVTLMTRRPAPRFPPLENFAKLAHCARTRPHSPLPQSSPIEGEEVLSRS